MLIVENICFCSYIRGKKEKQQHNKDQRLVAELQNSGSELKQPSVMGHSFPELSVLYASNILILICCLIPFY